jgi:hypothetical protein
MRVKLVARFTGRRGQESAVLGVRDILDASWLARPGLEEEIDVHSPLRGIILPVTIDLPIHPSRLAPIVQAPLPEHGVSGDLQPSTRRNELP